MNSTCPICFEDLVIKNRVTPDICDHIFCSPCLEKWSKHGSYCPVDRKRFQKIVNLDSETVIQIKPCRPKQTRVLYDITTYCEVCKKANNASTLLLCDCCDLGYHCKCLQPPLQEVPPGVWYCPVCVAVDTKIKKSKDPKTVQKENAARINKKDIPTKSSQDVFSCQTNPFNSEGIAGIHEQSSGNRTESASTMKSNPRSDTNDKTIMSTDNILVSETEADKSIKIKNLIAATSNVKDHLTAQISIKNTVQNKHYETISSWSKRLRKKDPDSKSNEIVTYCSLTGQSDSKQEQHNKNEIKTTASLVKGEQISVCPLSKISDFENNSLKREGFNNFKTENNSSLSMKLRNKSSRLNTNKGKSYSCTSLETIKQNKSSSCSSEVIQNSGEFNEVQENHKNLIHSNNLSNSSGQSISNANKGLQLHEPNPSNTNTVFSTQKNSKNRTKSSKYCSEYSKSQSKATRRSVRNIYDENKNKICVLTIDPEITKKKRNLRVQIRDSEGSMISNTYINTPDNGTNTQGNINKDIVPKLRTKEKQPIIKDYVQPSTEEPLNENNQDPYVELQHRKVNDATIETNFENTNWCIHYCQKPDKYSASCLKKRNSIKSEKLGHKELPSFQTNGARNESIIPSTAEEFQKNVIVASQNKKEYCRNVQSMLIDVKNDILSLVDSKILISETPVYKVSKESERRETFLRLDNSNRSLTKESGKYKLNTNGSLSIDETGVLIHPESSGNAKYYYLTKKSISNFAMEKLSLFAAEKNEEQNINKMGHKWYHYEEKDPAISNNKVFNNNIQSTAVTALSATSGKYEEPSNLKKSQQRSYRIEGQDPAISINEVFEKSIQSTAVTAQSASTGKYKTPSSKKKTGHGRYYVEKKDPALCNSDILETDIHSTVFTTLSATPEKISEDKTGQSSCHKEKKDSAHHNNVSEKSIYSTISTVLSATSKKYKKPSKNKTGHGWYHYEDEDTGIANSKIPETSIQSTICTALSSTPKKYKETSKNKRGHGWYHYEDEDPAIPNSKISEKRIQSKIVPEENQAGSQKPTLCAGITKVKNYTLRKAPHTSDNISNFNSFKQDPITALPKFSVFESVDNTCVSRQKYLSMNKSFMDASLSSKNTLSLFAKTSVNPLKGNKSDITPCAVETASLAMKPPKSYRSREVHYAIKAKVNLADELLKIEREKWPQHLKKYKYRRSSCSKYPKKRNRDACGSEIKNK